jgi:hypothetical protein
LDLWPTWYFYKIVPLCDILKKFRVVLTLFLGNILDFHCGDYEECRLLGYKNPVRTSNETYYISDAEHSRLMICKIWSSQGSDYGGDRLVWCDAVWTLYESIFRRNLEPLSLKWKIQRSRNNSGSN